MSAGGFPDVVAYPEDGYAWVATRDPDPDLVAKADDPGIIARFEIPIESGIDPAAGAQAVAGSLQSLRRKMCASALLWCNSRRFLITSEQSASTRIRLPVMMNASAKLNAMPPSALVCSRSGFGTARWSLAPEIRLPSTPPARKPAPIVTAGDGSRVSGIDGEQEHDAPECPEGRPLMERPVGRRHEDVDPKVECRQR